jgi:hypothetical protein
MHGWREASHLTHGNRQNPHITACTLLLCACSAERPGMSMSAKQKHDCEPPTNRNHWSNSHEIHKMSTWGRGGGNWNRHFATDSERALSPTSRGKIYMLSKTGWEKEALPDVLWFLSYNLKSNQSVWLPKGALPTDKRFCNQHTI